MALPTISVLIVQTIAKTTLAEQIRDGLVDFLVSQAKDLGKQEISDRIAKLRSDHKLREEVQGALEVSARRWAEDCTDRDLVAAVAQNSRFTDLPSVQEAILTIAKNPFNPVPSQMIVEKFAEVLPKSFDITRVQSGVGELMEILREEFVAVTGLHETHQLAVEIQSLRANKETAQHTANIEVILARLEKGPSPTDKTLYDYLTWVMDQHRYLDPRGTMQTVRQVQLKLKDIFVSLQAEPELPLSGVDRRIYESEVDSLMAREDLSEEEKEDVRENLLAKILPMHEEGITKGEARDLRELTADESKLVILGDPGSGKTTLMRYLAFQHAETLRGITGINKDQTEVRLPIYLRIAEYAEHEDGHSLIDFLPYNVCGKARDKDPLPQLLLKWLETGKCLVLLDGLDEVIEPAQRGEIAGQINSFIRKFESSGNRFVVTSRVAGYRSAPLAGDIAHFRIQDMNDEQIQLFLTQWCRAVERFQTPDLPEDLTNQRAQAEIDDILQSIRQSQGVRRLATNPLLLRTLALIHKNGSRLPARRIDLYRLAAETLIRDWELARGIPEAALVQEGEATSMLAELAAWLHEEKPAGIAAQGEVRQKLAEVKGRLVGKEAEHPDVLQAVDRFLDQIRQHTGLFVERAPRRFGFMHLTFEEYFAARYLVMRPKRAAKLIRCRLHNPRWREPILLAIGFYGTEFPDDVDDMVEEAILGKDLGGPSPYEDLLHRDLLFAMRVMGDQELGPVLRGRLVNQFVSLWNVRENEAEKFDALQREMQKILQDLKGSLAERDLIQAFYKDIQSQTLPLRIHSLTSLSHYAHEIEVAKEIERALTDKNAKVRSAAATALHGPTVHSEVVPSLLQALHDENAEVRKGAAYALSGATGHPEVVPALLQALHDEDKEVRAGADYALEVSSEQPETVKALLCALHDENAEVRKGAAYALLGASDHPEVVPALLQALHDQNAEVRSRAANALSGTAAHPEVVPALLQALHDDNAEVRSAAAAALRGATGCPEVVPALLLALQGENAEVCRGAASALSGATGHPEVVPALLQALQGENAEVRSAAAAALRGATGYPEVVPALLRALQGENVEVRRGAASALSGTTGHPEVVPALLQALHDDNAEVRSAAATALRGATGHSEVVPVLLQALHDEDTGVRARVNYTLGRFGEQPESVKALLYALHDENAEVRKGVVHALARATGHPEVVPALLRALDDENAEVRSGAASALSGAIGYLEVVPALLQALHDENAEVRRSCALSLANHKYSIEELPKLISSLGLMAQLISEKDSGEHYYQRVRGKIMRASLSDLLFLIIQSYAPGPCREA